MVYLNRQQAEIDGKMRTADKVRMADEAKDIDMANEAGRREKVMKCLVEETGLQKSPNPNPNHQCC